MIKLHTIIASVFGIGYVAKGGGTVAAMAYCLIWFFLPAGYTNNGWQLAVVTAILILGTWSSGEVDRIWGKDSNKVVIDEVAGMAIALLYVPVNGWYLVIGLVAFRFFDIVKPFGVRNAELLPKGWGVMADDVLAGLYALVITQSSIWIGNKLG